MAVMIIEAQCVGCSLCMLECPEDAITVRSLANIDKKKCIECLICIGCCPNNAIEEAQS